MEKFTGSAHSWNQLTASLPMPHLLQTWEWSQLKARFGWQPLPFLWTGDGASREFTPRAAAMILKRTIPVAGFAKKMCVLYIPKGPNLDWGDMPLRKHVLDDLQAFSRQQGAIFIKMDPDVPLGIGVPGRSDAGDNAAGAVVKSELGSRGWQFSQDQIQFRNTVLIDLAQTEAEMLARMKQKTRYNINLAQKKGVSIRRGTAQDSSLLYRMYAETSIRDGFLIRGEEYYRAVWELFDSSTKPGFDSSMPFTEPLIAEVNGEPVAAISVFYFARQATYLFGMSRNQHREKMPNYLLQWEAIRRAKELGCQTYNLWGAPDDFIEQDPMWGVFRFKEGLGGYVLRTLGAYDYNPNPILYRLYTRILPKIMNIMRFRGNLKTRQGLGA